MSDLKPGDFDEEGDIQSDMPDVKYMCGIVWIGSDRLDEARKNGWEFAGDFSKDGNLVTVYRK